MTSPDLTRMILPRVGAKLWTWWPHDFEDDRERRLVVVKAVHTEQLSASTVCVTVFPDVCAHCGCLRYGEDLVLDLMWFSLTQSGERLSLILGLENSYWG